MTLSSSIVTLGLALSAPNGAPPVPATVLLEKSATSGHVPPEFRFQKSCAVTDEGRVTSVISLGNVDGGLDTTQITRSVRKKTVRKLRSLIAKAKGGRIEITPAPCDIGSKRLNGYFDGEAVEIDVTVDCDANRVNQSKAAEEIKAIATNICRF